MLYLCSRKIDNITSYEETNAFYGLDIVGVNG